MLDNPSYLLADGIAPLIIFGLIIFIQFLFKSLTKGEAADDEVAEAEAKHKEELREKIRARMEAARQANQGKPVSPQTIIRDVFEEERPRMQEPTVIKAPELVRERPEPSVFSSEDPMAAIKRRIEALRQQGIDAQHKVEAIQSKAKVSKRTPRKHVHSVKKTGSLRSSIKDSLSNPRSAQQAILMAEILGKPKGLQ
jgi:hypothetical protein